MTKSTVKIEENTISGTAEGIVKLFKNASSRIEAEEVDEKDVIITKAGFSGLFCNYSYELVSGITKGDELNRKGSLIVHDDMHAAFKKLHPHFAVLCEEIEASKIRDIESIADYDADAHSEKSIEYKVSRFSVESFTIKGTGENRAFILNGTKMLSTGECISFATPKTELEGDYHFINELKVAIDDCVFEVEEYMKGKSKPKMVQMEIAGLDGDNTNESFDQTEMN